MGGCSILGCNSRTERNREDGVTFHSFPMDGNLKNVWINATGQLNWQPNKFSKICSLHFNNDAIKFVNKVKRIKPDAIPVKYVYASVNQSISIQDSNIQNKRSTSKLVNKKRQQKIICSKSSQKSVSLTVTTPRKEKLLQAKLEKSRILSAKRLLMIQAIREVNRRLINKNAKLQTMLMELQSKMKLKS